MKNILFITLLIFSTQSSSAPLANTNNSDFYYEIGGARSISEAANAGVKTKVINASYEYGLGYSCGNFNPLTGVANAINGLKNTKDKLILGATGAVTSAIGSLPALIMQRVDPGLYDLFQNALIRAEATIALATKTCEDYEQQIQKGENPFKDWTDVSKGIDWKLQMGTKGFGTAKNGVHTAKKKVQTNNGSKGVPWIGGKKAGGKNQPPIKPTTDVVKAGYNLTLNRKVNEDKAPVYKKGDVVPRLAQVFKSPKDATQFAVDVVGDVAISTFDNHPVKTTPGYGLLPKIEKETDTIEKGLVGLVSGKSKLSLDNLDKVSSNDVLINGDVIQAIKRLKPTEKAVSISKLASEAAMSKVMEKALIIRRMLITGKREPNISQTPASKHINESVEQLDKDIENILFEKRIHTELASQTPSLILKLQHQHENRTLSYHDDAPGEDKIVEDGAIK